MKTERLLGIAFYLMNRGTTSARALAERFEVSKRTIQRDIEALCTAGVPIASTYGAEGGYELLEGFRPGKRPMDAGDYANIVTALQALYTAYGDRRVEQTLDKISSAGAPEGPRSVFLDFGALREGQHTPRHIGALKAAVEGKRAVCFAYTDADGRQSDKAVDPLALLYKWHAWYLFGFDAEKRVYRLYKLARIGEIRTGGPFGTVHGDADALLTEYFSKDDREYWDIRMRCDASVRVPALEYLGGTVTEELDNGDFILEMRLPANERMWFSLVMGFGNAVRVLAPEELKERLRQRAGEIVAAYRD